LNITHNTESIAVWNLKPERWGSPLVQEKYQGEQACDRRQQHNNNNNNNLIIPIQYQTFRTAENVWNINSL
jgi:hypothetical protein